MNRIDVAIEAARAAGKILKVGRERDLQVEEKDSSHTSIVTWADLQSQAEIFRIIRARFPSDAIIGEEGTDGDATNRSRWYVDPLDGTSNYSHGLPFYCISIAYCDNAGIALGVVLDPFHDDLFVAERDKGATHNGSPISVSDHRELRTSLLSTQVQSTDPAVLDRYAARHRRFAEAARAVRSLGAPALALAYVARGWLDAFCEPNISPWDSLAGQLLIEEAGGTVSTFTGKPRLIDSYSDLLGTNGHIHERMIGLLAPEMRPGR
jgi:myo-inositol-1(or 4)-monophosphatase